MIIHLSIFKKKYSADLSAPLGISIPIKNGNQNPNCYWADPVKFDTIVTGDFIGNVKAGGSVNYQRLTITPHGNGTHTECYGHIASDETATINQSLTRFHFVAEVISVLPESLANGDSVIPFRQVKEKIKHPGVDALVIRTIPNPETKKTQHYSGTNPTYLASSIAEFLAASNIQHLLIDLPSIDRETDEGKLLAHKAFWKFPDSIRKDCTITELIYVDNYIPDGLYLLNLQIANLEMDASPSNPVLYKLEEVS